MNKPSPTHPVNITLMVLSFFYRYWSLFVLCILSGFFAYFPITDSDIWWHLATAREMITQKSFLTHDPFSYTESVSLWINCHWFFQLLCYIIYKTYTESGLVIFKCSIIIVVSFLLSQVFSDKKQSLLTALFTGLLFFEARYLILIRPVLITILCMSLFLFFFERFRKTSLSFFLWILLPIQVIWTNSQGLFLISLGIAGSYWTEAAIEFFYNKQNEHNIQRFKRLSIFIISLIFVFVINPYGIDAVVYPFKLLKRIFPTPMNIYSINISENIPLYELFKTNSRLLYATVIASSIVFLSFAANVQKIRISHLLLVLLFGTLAFMAERNILLYFVIIAPITAYNLLSYLSSCQSGKMAVYLKKSLLLGTIGISIVLLGFDVISKSRHISHYPSQSSISPFRFPDQAQLYLKSNHIEGNIFNDIRYGGYLLWNLPEKKVFIDGRLIIRSPAFFSEYLTILDHPELMESVSARFNITHMVLPSAIFYRSMRLIRWLYYSNEWKLVFTDGSSVVFFKSDYSNIPSINLHSKDTITAIIQSLQNRWKKDPKIFTEACYHLKNLLNFLEIHDRADEINFVKNDVSPDFKSHFNYTPIGQYYP